PVKEENASEPGRAGPGRTASAGAACELRTIMIDLLPILVFAKLPAPGSVKTRLTPNLHATQAAAVHEAFLQHFISRLVELHPAELIVCYDPPTAGDAMRSLLGSPAGVTYMPQSPGDLGQRLATAFDALKGRHRRMIFLGVDSPDLPADHLRDAARLCQQADVVLGPTEDGGYWCLALAGTVDAARLLSGIEWSTGHEAQQTIDNASALHYAVAMADGWDDVDRPDDLQRLMQRLQASAEPRDRT